MSGYMIGGEFYRGSQIRHPVDGSCVDGFLMGSAMNDTNGKNIDLLSGVVRDLIKQVDRLTREVNELKNEHP